jgi:hypothetical protein
MSGVYSTELRTGMALAFRAKELTPTGVCISEENNDTMILCRGYGLWFRE